MLVAGKWTCSARGRDLSERLSEGSRSVIEQAEWIDRDSHRVIWDVRTAIYIVPPARVLRPLRALRNKGVEWLPELVESLSLEATAVEVGRGAAVSTTCGLTASALLACFGRLLAVVADADNGAAAAGFSPAIVGRSLGRRLAVVGHTFCSLAC